MSFARVDTREEAGGRLADSFGVEGLPHFVLMRPDGAIVDRWVGFVDAPGWTGRLRDALADTASVAAKEARFAEHANARDAVAIARVRVAERKWADAARLYEQAGALDPASRDRLALSVFEAKAQALDAVFSVAEVRAAADAVARAQGSGAGALVTVAATMADIARGRKDPSIATPYLPRALEASAGSRDPRISRARKDLLVLEALWVKQDPDQAASLEKEALGEGWTSDPNRLNEYAWWCFENGAVLPEAEAMARRAVDLAAAGRERAMILDTVAEIAAARGNAREAAELSARAAKEDPAEPRFAEQVRRFQALAQRSSPAAGASANH